MKWQKINQKLKRSECRLMIVQIIITIICEINKNEAYKVHE